MHLATNDIPVKIHTEGATARQQPDFGDAVGRLGAEQFKMQAGTDLAPLLKGLERDACQSAHWGYIIAGCVIVDYTDGTSETCVGGDMVHWPAGHSVRVAEDAELVRFSPEADHTPVLDHLAGQLSTT
jgi:hypothetical protein